MKYFGIYVYALITLGFVLIVHPKMHNINPYLYLSSHQSYIQDKLLSILLNSIP